MRQQIYAIRLLPGSDLKSALQQIVTTQNIEAGWIVTCVGSLTQYNLRFANQHTGVEQTGYFEILSLSGTLAMDGLHLHITIADEKGNTIGGHLLEGCIVYTTAEIIIWQSKDYFFKRENDGTTPWKELQIISNDPLPG